MAFEQDDFGHIVAYISTMETKGMLYDDCII